MIEISIVAALVAAGATSSTVNASRLTGQAKADDSDMRPQHGQELACPTEIPRELTVRDVRALLEAIRRHSKRHVRHIYRSSECTVHNLPSVGKGRQVRADAVAPTAPSIVYFSTRPPIPECPRPPVLTYAVVVIAAGDCAAGDGDTFHARRAKGTWRVQRSTKRSAAWGRDGGGSVE
jgi:hypothetical protein